MGEREKRDFSERLDQEKQAHQQSVKKFEKVKRELDKLAADSAIISQERSDAVSQRGKELEEVKRLEADRRDLFARIDVLERQKVDKKETAGQRNNIGDLNMKLKLETGDLRAENDRLVKANEQI